jgi:hypothetical protein
MRRLGLPARHVMEQMPSRCEVDVLSALNYFAPEADRWRGIKFITSLREKSERPVATEDCCLMSKNGQTHSTVSIQKPAFHSGTCGMSLIFDRKFTCLKHFSERLAIDCDA